MITAEEQGRHLAITVGDGDEAIIFKIQPLNTKTGAALFALWAGVAFGQSETPEVDAEGFSRLAVGEENWAALDELRWAETERVINAAFFWQTQGGGIAIVNELLGEGFPKAQETLLRANGLWEVFSQLQTYLSGVSGNQTPPRDDTPGTSTPNGISKNLESTIDKLPKAKKSINQNTP
jgi:hypothetical protein